MRILVIHVLDDRIYIRGDSDKDMRLIDRAELLKVIEGL